MGLTVYTGGSFDLFHSGHVAFLRRCKRLAGKGGKVVVSLNSDEFILDYKGKGLVMTFAERRAVLKACRYVDEVIENWGGADSTTAIGWVCPDLIVIGSDWARKDYLSQLGITQDWLDEQNIGLVYLPYTSGISSTDIKARLSGKL